MNIAVFCAASDVAEKYTNAAHECARIMGERGHALVWGGSNGGLMKVMADGVQATGGKIYGVSVEILRHKARPSADEMIFAKDMGERKALMLKRADAIVVLVGGIGTLDEVTDVLELRKHSLHRKLIVVLNTDGFYDGLKMQLEKMKEDGFLKLGGVEFSLDDMIRFADTPETAMEYIESYGN